MYFDAPYRNLSLLPDIRAISIAMPRCAREEQACSGNYSSKRLAAVMVVATKSAPPFVWSLVRAISGGPD